MNKRDIWLLVGIIGLSLMIVAITALALLAFKQIYFSCEIYMALGTSAYVFLLILWFHIPPNDDDEKK